MIDHCAGDIGNKNIARKNQNIQRHPLYTRRANSHRLLHHLHVIQACLSYYSYVLFLPFESFFKYLCILLKKNFLVNKYNKQMYYKENNVRLNLDCKGSIRFGIFQVANEESFRKSFSFPFSAKCFDRNFMRLF